MKNYNLEDSKEMQSSWYVRFLNVHPKGLRTGDCVCRAIALATDTPYLELRRALNKLKRDGNYESYRQRRFIRHYLEDIIKANNVKCTVEKGEHRITGKDFCDNNPYGVYILNMAHHLTCCIDGKIYDTWDCGDKCVYNAWKI